MKMFHLASVFIFSIGVSTSLVSAQEKEGFACLQNLEREGGSKIDHPNLLKIQIAPLARGSKTYRCQILEVSTGFSRKVTPLGQPTCTVDTSDPLKVSIKTLDDELDLTIDLNQPISETKYKSSAIIRWDSPGNPSKKKRHQFDCSRAKVAWKNPSDGAGASGHSAKPAYVNSDTKRTKDKNSVLTR